MKSMLINFTDDFFNFLAYNWVGFAHLVNLILPWILVSLLTFCLGNVAFRLFTKESTLYWKKIRNNPQKQLKKAKKKYDLEMTARVTITSFCYLLYYFIILKDSLMFIPKSEGVHYVDLLMNGYSWFLLIAHLSILTILVYGLKAIHYRLYGIIKSINDCKPSMIFLP